jgi:type 1 glutamine amidotransferase
MKKAFAILTVVGISLAQQTPPPAPGQQGGGRGGRGGNQNAPAVVSISKRPSGSSLGTIRVGAADNNIWFGWKVGIPTAAFKQLSWSEALVHADTLGVASVEVSSVQKTAPEVPKPFDSRLQAGERNAVNYRLRELNQQVGAYRVETTLDPARWRDTFEFAKAINAPLMIVSDQAPIADLDKLAEDFGINVAVESRKDLKVQMAALNNRGSHIGMALDLGTWSRAILNAADLLATIKDRLMAVRVPANNPLSGNFYLAAYKAGTKPLYITIEPAGLADTYADFQRQLTAFERAMWPAMAARVRAMLDTPAGKIRGPERLSAEMRAKIEAASPHEPIVKPKKPRKLLVTDIQMYSGHETIPHGTYMLELMGKNTGAFTPTFSNDQDMLKYPKIKEFDAVFLNNVCGMVHNDPEVREGILRFVREGGGIAGNHAVTFANNHWPEFAEMMGGWAGAHHTEKQVIKIDDPNSPLMKSFGTVPFEHVDEFYQFPPGSPYSREKQHILMSIDVEKSDRATAGKFCDQCTRPDQDYGLAWIRTYGKGRTYFTPLGHTATMYTDTRWTQHMLAAVQYILGDLDADATPSKRR